MPKATTSTSQYSTVHITRADALLAELALRLKKPLAEITDDELDAFRYQSAIHVYDLAYQAARVRLSEAR